MQMQPIHMGVKDAHPYVRRTAVMGVLKVYNLDQVAVRNAGNFLPPPPPTRNENQFLFRRCNAMHLSYCQEDRP